MYGVCVCVVLCVVEGHGSHTICRITDLSERMQGQARFSSQPNACPLFTVTHGEFQGQREMRDFCPGEGLPALSGVCMSRGLVTHAHIEGRASVPGSFSPSAGEPLPLGAQVSLLCICPCLCKAAQGGQHMTCWGNLQPLHLLRHGFWENLHPLFHAETWIPCLLCQNFCSWAKIHLSILQVGPICYPIWISSCSHTDPQSPGHTFDKTANWLMTVSFHLVIPGLGIVATGRPIPLDDVSTPSPYEVLGMESEDL